MAIRVEYSTAMDKVCLILFVLIFVVLLPSLRAVADLGTKSAKHTPLLFSIGAPHRFFATPRQFAYCTVGRQAVLISPADRAKCAY